MVTVLKGTEKVIYKIICLIIGSIIGKSAYIIITSENVE